MVFVVSAIAVYKSRLAAAAASASAAEAPPLDDGQLQVPPQRQLEDAWKAEAGEAPEGLAPLLDLAEPVVTRHLAVNYSAGLPIRPGHEYSLKDIKASGRPRVQLADPGAVDPHALYTLIMLDFDVPASSKPAFLHWLVMNIPGADVTAGSDSVGLVGATGGAGGEQWGETRADYLPPAPPQPNVLHRYFFLLFKQQRRVPGPSGSSPDPDQQQQQSSSSSPSTTTTDWDRHRAKFHLPEFVEANGLKAPALALNFFRTQQKHR